MSNAALAALTSLLVLLVLLVLLLEPIGLVDDIRCLYM
jgi:hypothetical protein